MGNDDLNKAVRDWEDTSVQQTLDQYPERYDEFITTSGDPVNRLYTPLDSEHAYLDGLGFPGEYPFTRGVHPTMFRGRLWTMRMFAGFGTAEETKRLIAEFSPEKTQDFTKKSIDFHHLLVKAAHITPLLMFHNVMATWVLRRLISVFNPNKKERESSTREHEAIFQALINKEVIWV